MRESCSEADAIFDAVVERHGVFFREGYALRQPCSRAHGRSVDFFDFATGGRATAGYHNASASLKVGAVVGILGVKHREDVFPGIFFGRTVESSEDKHRNLCAHAYAEKRAASRKVENLEEGSPDHDGCAYRIGEVEKPLTFLAMEKAFYDVGVFFNLDHNKSLLFSFGCLLRSLFEIARCEILYTSVVHSDTPTS